MQASPTPGGTTPASRRAPAHLKGELVLLLVGEGHGLADHIVEVVLHELHGAGKLVLFVVSGGVEVGIVAGGGGGGQA